MSISLPALNKRPLFRLNWLLFPVVATALTAAFMWTFVTWIPSLVLLGTVKDLRYKTEQGQEVNSLERLTKALGVTAPSTKDTIATIFVYGDPHRSRGLWLDLSNQASPAKEPLTRWILDAAQKQESSLSKDDLAAFKQETTRIYETFKEDLIFNWRRYFTGGIQVTTVFVFMWCVLLILWQFLMLMRERSLMIPANDEPGLLDRVSGYFVVKGDERINLPACIVASAGAPLESVVQDFVNKAAPHVGAEDFRSRELLAELTDQTTAPKGIDIATKKAIVDSGLGHLEHVMDTDTHVPKWMIGALPALGFIGTIVGIGAGLSLADGPIAATEKAVRVLKVQNLTTTLGIAFDTTFVSLLLSLIATLLLTGYLRYRDHFLGQLRVTLERYIRV
jgi:hypothetical protein